MTHAVVTTRGIYIPLGEKKLRRVGNSYVVTVPSNIARELMREGIERVKVYLLLDGEILSR